MLFKSELQFNNLFTLKNAHLVQIVIFLECKQILQWNLTSMWIECSSISNGNLEKNTCYSSREIEFFLGVTFLARPVHIFCFTLQSRTLNTYVRILEIKTRHFKIRIFRNFRTPSQPQGAFVLVVQTTKLSARYGLAVQPAASLTA